MKIRPTKAQRNEIRAAQFATRAFRDQLRATRPDMHHLVIDKMQSSEEDKARSNPYGSRFYRKIYTTGPMTSAEIKKALGEKV
jgi:hypothetical protein